MVDAEDIPVGHSSSCMHANLGRRKAAGWGSAGVEPNSATGVCLPAAGMGWYVCYVCIMSESRVSSPALDCPSPLRLGPRCGPVRAWWWGWSAAGCEEGVPLVRARVVRTGGGRGRGHDGSEF